MPQPLYQRLRDLAATEPRRVCAALDVARCDDSPLPDAPAVLRPLFGSGVGTRLGVALLGTGPREVALWVSWSESEAALDEPPVPLRTGLEHRLAASRAPAASRWMATALALDEQPPAPPVPAHALRALRARPVAEPADDDHEDDDGPNTLSQAIATGDLAVFDDFFARQRLRPTFESSLGSFLKAIVQQPADVALPMLARLTDDGARVRPEHGRHLARCASQSALQWLVDAGADPNHAQDDGRTPLCFAGRPERIRWLIAAGAAPNATDARYRTPLFHQTHADDAQACVMALIDAGADPDATDDMGQHFWEFAPRLQRPAPRSGASRRTIRRRRR